MSAFIVEDDLIDLLITVAIGNPALAGCYENDITRRPEFETSAPKRAAWEEAGQMLVNENYRSVNHRYRENAEPHPYEFKAYMGALEPVDILKACQCYDYQACETSDYWTTPAAKFVDEIRKRAIRRLPRYEDAEWGASNPARRKAA